MSLLLLQVALTGLLMHPVHETFCEVQWNDETKRTEVALRLSIQDEQWIIKHHRDEQPETEADRKSQVPWQQRFLNRQMVFDPVAPNENQSRARATHWHASNAPSRWIGRKEDGGYVWWFFEVSRKDEHPVRKIRSRLLFDLDETYQHRVLVHSTSKAVVLTKQEPIAELSF